MQPRLSPSASLQFDIVVNGGSFSAPAAAIAAARVNPAAQVLLVEPTDWLGGQSTSQGVSAIDNAWHSPGGALMRDNQAIYYPADYLDFLNRLKNKPPEAPGTGMAPNGSAWVSREAFDPRTGAWVLDQMTSAIAEPHRDEDDGGEEASRPPMPRTSSARRPRSPPSRSSSARRSTATSPTRSCCHRNCPTGTAPPIRRTSPRPCTR